MKILVISQINSLCKYGGGETFNRELIKYLLNQGHEVLEWSAYIGQNISRYENLYEKNKNYHLVYSKIFQKHPNKIKKNIFLNFFFMLKIFYICFILLSNYFKKINYSSFSNFINSAAAILSFESYSNTVAK
mgnify:CR=1 FL=1